MTDFDEFEEERSEANDGRGQERRAQALPLGAATSGGQLWTRKNTFMKTELWRCLHPLIAEQLESPHMPRPAHQGHPCIEGFRPFRDRRERN